MKFSAFLKRYGQESGQESAIYSYTVTSLRRMEPPLEAQSN